MFTKLHSTGFAAVGALLLFASAPLRAQNLVLRNDTQAAVVVHPMSVSAGVVRRARPILLNPKAMTLPAIMLPGDRIITIYDASVPTRILFKGTLPASSTNRAYAIQPDLPAPRVTLVPIPYPTAALP